MKTEAPKKKVLEADPEIQAMGKINRLMAALEPDVRWRVLRWMNGKWQTEPAPEKKNPDLDGSHL